MVQKVRSQEASEMTDLRRAYNEVKNELDAVKQSQDDCIAQKVKEAVQKSQETSGLTELRHAYEAVKSELDSVKRHA